MRANDQPTRARAGTPGRRLRTAGRALLLTVAAAAIAPQGALAIGGGDYPTEVPPVYPGTSQAVSSWKNVGRVVSPNYPDKYSSGVQVAPRWVIATEHLPLDIGATFATVDRGAATVVASFIPKKADGERAVDFSIGLLSHALTAPTGGFPKILEDNLGGLSSVVPGKALYAGLGATAWERTPEPKVAWASLDGVRAPGHGPISFVPGDSGSTVFWHPSASAQPVIRAITAMETGGASFGGPLGFSDTIGSPIVGSTATTLAAYMRESFAKFPGVPAPSFTTTAAITPLNTLRPVQPENFTALRATATSVTLRWSPSGETRVPHTGFTLTRPGAAAISLPATATEHTVTGLTAGQTYTWTLRAVNANGSSADRPNFPSAPTTVSYAVRTAPGAVRNATFTGARRISSGAADYCLTTSWDEPAAIAGTTVTGYVVRFDGRAPTGMEHQPGTRTGRFCGLTPGSAHQLEIRAVSDLTASLNLTRLSTTAPTGVPSGTAIPVPVLGTVAVRAARSAPNVVDYCLDVAWSAPTEVAGYPVTSYNIELRRGNSNVGALTDLPPTTRVRTLCELEPNAPYNVRVTATYAGEQSVSSARSASLWTPAGAPLGTLLEPPRALTATTTRSADGTACVRVTWDAPLAGAGAPVTTYSVLLTGAGGASVGAENDLDPATRTTLHCGLSANRTHPVTVWAAYGVNGTVSATTTAPLGS